MALCGECALDGPSRAEPCPERSLLNSKGFSSSRYRWIWTYLNIGALIPALLKACRPAAITWFVVAVIVDSVYGVFRRRSRTHVGIERQEVCSPCIAHGNSTASIVPIRWALGAVASCLYLCPYGVFWQRLRCAMLTPALRGFFAAQTTATFTVAAAEIATSDDNDCSAVADASIVGLFRIGSARPGFDAQPHKRLTRLVLDLHAPIIAWG